MDEQTTQQQKSNVGPIVAIVGIIVIVAAAYFGYNAMNKNATQTTNTTQTTQQTQTTETVPTTAMADSEKASSYKDGTYTVVGEYTSPGGPEELGVTLILAKGVVTDATVEVKATRPASKARQTDFAENYKTEIVGKNIDEINLGKVSGSSLTPKGFNDAVDKIKAEAKS